MSKLHVISSTPGNYLVLFLCIKFDMVDLKVIFKIEVDEGRDGWMSFVFRGKYIGSCRFSSCVYT